MPHYPLMLPQDKVAQVHVLSQHFTAFHCHYGAEAMPLSLAPEWVGIDTLKTHESLYLDMVYLPHRPDLSTLESPNTIK